jgi:hypothetical protein
VAKSVSSVCADEGALETQLSWQVESPLAHDAAQLMISTQAASSAHACDAEQQLDEMHDAHDCDRKSKPQVLPPPPELELLPAPELLPELLELLPAPPELLPELLELLPTTPELLPVPELLPELLEPVPGLPASPPELVGRPLEPPSQLPDEDPPASVVAGPGSVMVHASSGADVTSTMR